MSLNRPATGLASHWRAGVWLLAPLILLAGAWNLTAFQGDAEPAKGGEQEVIVRREAVRLLDPEIYRVPLFLTASRSVDLIAPVDGTVSVVSVKPGAKIRDKTEALRLNDARQLLVIKRAEAQLKGAQAERQAAEGKGGDPGQIAVADARIVAAQAELELANYDAAQLIVRTPFAGEIERVYVTEGEFVRAGQKLARLLDASQLRVEVPADRATTQAGGTLEISVEGTAVSAKVESLIALEERFQGVRDLVASPAQALVLIENSAGRLRPGQTVISPLLPQEPVTSVPAGAVANLPDGRRKVQVLRDNVVRNLTVRVLGRAGGDDVFVSGRFGPTDEVVVATTRELADGTPLRALAAGAGAKSGAKAAADKKKKPASTNSGF